MESNLSCNLHVHVPVVCPFPFCFQIATMYFLILFTPTLTNFLLYVTWHSKFSEPVSLVCLTVAAERDIVLEVNEHIKREVIADLMEWVCTIWKLQTCSGLKNGTIACPGLLDIFAGQDAFLSHLLDVHDPGKSFDDKSKQAKYEGVFF